MAIGIGATWHTEESPGVCVCADGDYQLLVLRTVTVGKGVVTIWPPGDLSLRRYCCGGGDVAL